MSLPQSGQDATLAATYEARPGASDAAPSGVHINDEQPLSSSVKNKLDGLADSAGSTKSASEQVPSAQGAGNAVKSGFSALLAGVSNLALGANQAVAHNASDSHPESDKVEKVDDLPIPGAFADATSETDNAEKVDDRQIPGAFDDETSDTEDIAAVKRGVKSAFDALPTPPSAQDVTNSLPTTDSISKQLPSAPLGSLTNQSEARQTADQNVDSVGNSLEQGQIHQDGIDHIKKQLHGQGTGSVASNSRETQIHQDGISHIKEQIYGQRLNSVGTNSTTNHLAGQVPLEPRGVPQIVTDSQRQAGFAPEASSNAEAVEEKKQLEQELKREVPESTINSAGPTGASAGVDRGIPQVVADSQKKADASPEASANVEAIREKQEVERELKREVPKQPATGDNSSTVGQAVSGGLASAGAAIAGAATYARQKTHEVTGTDPVAVLPETAQQAIDGKVTSHTPSSSTGTGPSTAQNLTGSLAAGAASVGSAAAGAATFAREKTHEATGTDPVAVLPTSVQEGIGGNTTAKSNTRHPYDNSSHVTPSRRALNVMMGIPSDGIDLHSGIHNGVVGDHLDDDSNASHRQSSGSHSGHWQPGTSATVAHVPSLRDVDLSAGVKNTVVGSGAKDSGIVDQ